MFTVRFHDLVTAEFFFFFESRFTRNDQNAHLNQPTQGHVWSWTVAPSQRNWRRLRMVWQI